MSFDTLGGVGDPFATVGVSMGVDYAAMNKGIQPIFFIEPVEDKAASEREGVVRFRDEERVRLIVAGDMFNQPVHPVDEDIKKRFADHYARWQADRTQKHIEGTPLRHWALLSPTTIAEFEASGVFSIENVRDLSDANISKFHDGRIWREKAKAWLDQAKDSGTATRLAAENERLRESVERLERTVADLAARVDDGETKRGPGRPPKGS